MNNEYIVHTETKGGCTLKIVQDTSEQTPDEWGDNSLFLVADHRDFYVKPPSGSTFESVVADYTKTHHVFGLEAYIHSGVRLALSNEGNFVDRQWDVSQLGAVLVSKKDWPTKEKARNAALGLIETWNDCLSGNVYGFMVEDERGEHIDSCWGFIGDYETSGVLEQGRDMLKAATTKVAQKERKDAYKKADIQKASELVQQYGLAVK